MADIITNQEAIPVCWELGDLSYKLDELQEKIRDQGENASESLVLSSRQIGKSYGSVVQALEECIKHPGCIVRICAPTLKQVADIVEDNLRPIIEDAPKDLVVPQRSSYRWKVGKSSLRLGALERAHVDGNRGGNARLIIMEEGGFVKSDDYKYACESVIGPQLLRSSGRLKHVSSPSEDPEHYLHTEILPKCELLGTLSRYTVHDSPSITPEQVQKAIELCGGEHTEAWRREYLAEIIRSVERSVIPKFNEESFYAFDLPTECFYHTTIDMGGVRDLSVALFHTYDFYRNKHIIFDELVFEANTPTSEIHHAVIHKEREYGIKPTRFADVPGQTQVDLNQELGFNVQIPPKADWRSAVNTMQAIFAKDEVEIHERCQFLLTSVKSGRFNQNKTDFDRTETLGHMDALAALMYALRVQNKSCPVEPVWKDNRAQSQNQFKPLYQSPDGREELASAIMGDQVASFKDVKPKKFGRFQ